MKNPFIAAVMMATAIAATVRENAFRSMPDQAFSKSSHRSRIPGKQHPAGSKLARKFIERSGNEWDGETIHTGELTKLNQERAARRAG